MVRILHTESSRGWGGQEIRILTEISEMRRRGHQVWLACAPDSELAKRVDPADQQVVHLSFAHNADINAICGLHALVRRQAIAVVNTHSSIDSWCAAFASLALPKISLVRTRHLSNPVRNNLPTRWLYRRPHAVVTTGEALREQLMRQVGVREASALSIPTGIAIERFAPALIDRSVLRREWQVADDEHLIGTIAMLRSWKGHPVLIDAMPAILARHPRARFVFIGHSTDGDTAKNAFLQRAKDLGVAERLLFAGYRTDIPQVLAALDLVVLPSTKNEGVPQSLSQSLCMAKPVVATAVGAVGEIVRHQQTGLLVPPADPLALGEAIIAQLDHPEQARTWAEAGRRLILAEYGIESMAAKTERLYHRLLTGRPAWPDQLDTPVDGAAEPRPD